MKNAPGIFLLLWQAALIVIGFLAIDCKSKKKLAFLRVISILLAIIFILFVIIITIVDIFN